MGWVWRGECVRVDGHLQVATRIRLGWQGWQGVRICSPHGRPPPHLHLHLHLHLLHQSRTHHPESRVRGGGWGWGPPLSHSPFTLPSPSLAVRVGRGQSSKKALKTAVS